MKRLFLLLALASPVQAVTYTFNVTLSSTATPAMRDELLSQFTTGQYLGTAKASPFFANTYSLAILGKNPNYQAPATGPLVTLDSLIEKAAKDNFLYGYASGVRYERENDLGLISGNISDCYDQKYMTLKNNDAQNCKNLLQVSSQTITAMGNLCNVQTQTVAFGTTIAEDICKKIVFGTQKIFPSLIQQCDTPNTLGFVDATELSCQTGLATASDDIYQQNFSTTTIVPGF